MECGFVPYTVFKQQPSSRQTSGRRHTLGHTFLLTWTRCHSLRICSISSQALNKNHIFRAAVILPHCRILLEGTGEQPSCKPDTSFQVGQDLSFAGHLHSHTGKPRFSPLHQWLLRDTGCAEWHTAK